MKAHTHVTAQIEEQANALISDQLRSVARVPIERARTTPTVHPHDLSLVKTSNPDVLMVEPAENRQPDDASNSV